MNISRLSDRADTRRYATDINAASRGRGPLNERHTSHIASPRWQPIEKSARRSAANPITFDRADVRRIPALLPHLPDYTRDTIEPVGVNFNPEGKRGLTRASV